MKKISRVNFGQLGNFCGLGRVGKTCKSWQNDFFERRLRTS